jgi:aquaporin Z
MPGTKTPPTNTPAIAAATPPSTATKLVAEALGTFLLVFGSIGAALFASDFGTGANGTSLGIGFLGVSLAFGLTLMAGIYTWGPISGGHFNPAVTCGLAAAGRFAWKDVPGYLVAQVVGGAVGTTLIVLIGLFGPDGWLSTAQDDGFASNGFGEHSPGGFGLGAAIAAEILFTAIFLLVILGVTHPQRGTAAFAGLAIGLTLTLIHLASIPIDNTSVNPARSIATAIYGGPDFLLQLWVFILFPVVGGLLAGYLHRALFEPKGTVPPAQKTARVK